MSESTPGDAAAAIAARYGTPQIGPVVAATPTIALQLANRSVRAFLERPVDEAHLTAVLAAAQSAPTSSNLQSYSIVVVTDPERRARIGRLSNSSRPIADAPLTLVFVADLARARALAAHAGAADRWSHGFDAMLVAVVDAALAAENAALAAASLGLGTVFVGSIRDRPEEVAAELGLPEGAAPVFGLAVGWPDPAESTGVKPRLPMGVVVHRERYRAAESEEFEAYDATVRDYYRGQGLERGWVARVVERLERDPGVRARMREAFERLGVSAR